MMLKEILEDFQCFIVEQGYNLIEGEYDCIIRSRYDLGTRTPIRLENLDLSKVNISNHHWETHCNG